MFYFIQIYFYSLKSIGIPADYVHKLTRMFQDIKISQDLSQELKEIRSDNSFTGN